MLQCGAQMVGRRRFIAVLINK
ncbi:protein of unknown function [Paraburkholderia kururiensis]